MTRDELNALRPRDLIRHKSSGDAYIVHAHSPNRVVAVRVVEASNPIEWDQVDEDGRVISS